MMPSPEKEYQLQYQSEEEVLMDIRKEHPYPQKALTYLHKENKESITRMFHGLIPDRRILADIFNQCLLDFQKVVELEKFQIRGNNSISRYLYTIVKNGVNRWLKYGTIKGFEKDKVETRIVPSPVEAYRKQKEDEIVFFEKIRSIFREKIRSLLKNMPDSCSSLLSEKFGIPLIFIDLKENEIAQISPKELIHLPEKEEGKTDKELAKDIGKGVGAVNMQKRRCLNRFFIAAVHHPDTAYKRIVINTIMGKYPRYARLLESYWELSPQVIKYLNYKMSAKERENYEILREKDPRLLDYEAMMVKWTKTRIESDEIDNLDLQETGGLEISFPIKERRKGLKFLSVLDD